MFEHKKKFDQVEKSLLIGVKTSEDTKRESELSLTELENLAKSCLAVAKLKIFTTLRGEIPSTFLGKGKLEEVKLLLENGEFDSVIIDFDLSPAQHRNLEKALCIKVIDRTALILDLFARHASTREGKLQVELAQSIYLFPRLTGMWMHFGRSGGGIGSLGPGETQLELDRRLVRDKIASIRQSLKKVSSTRILHRSKRESIPIPIVSIVGYTNAGKSTLLNQLTDAGVLAKDQLFATLDPKLKKYRLPSGREVLFADTVGFIRRLPHQLVEAFKSTFEEVSRSTLLIHLVDISHPAWRLQAKTVRRVLKEMHLNNKKSITVYNKIDANPDFNYKRGIKISAQEKLGFSDLVNAIEDRLSQREQSVELLFPYKDLGQLSQAYKYGRVLERKDLPEGVKVQVTLNRKFRKMMNDYQVLGI